VRRVLLTILVAAVAATAAGAAPARAAGEPLQTAQVGRLPFPERGYVVDLPPGLVASRNAVRVTENGKPVEHVDVAPLGAAGINYGTVLAIDTSLSMKGKPLTEALSAARSFVAHRASGQQIGLVAFDGRVRVLRGLDADAGQLTRLLSRSPSTGFGTRIYDALDQSLTELDHARLATASIVLLSDGADYGSVTDIDKVIAKARKHHVRIFTIGFRSGAFAPVALEAIAEQSGGSFAQASSAAQLASIYSTLGQRLAGEYVVRYRSNAAPESDVQVRVAVRGVGTATTHYVAPTPSGLAPFHRSLVSRFVLSGLAVALLTLLVASLAAVAVLTFLSSRSSHVVQRVEEFAGGQEEEEAPVDEEAWHKVAMRRARLEGHGWLARIERQLEIARIENSATQVVLVTLGATALAMLVLGLITPVFLIVGLATPLMTRSWIGRRLRAVRDEFADQLPPNLQVLASALRVGHSFVSSLSVVVDNAHEPSKSELQRVLTDEQIGVPVEEAIRRVAARMDSRDLEQVALLAELQRTAGGNAAEVLDTVVETLRERADLRRLIKTLTAQGRMARWILSALPVAALLVLLAIQPTAIVPMLHSSIGQIGLVVAAVLVITGSLIIQKIVDIKV
jgi:tight adherence protein B